MVLAAETYDIVPPQLTVKAMRDNGYKTTAHAVAELIDNSAQAQASLVQLFCVEEPGVVQERSRHRIATIAVLDNGHGMDAATLRMALQFGNGTHLEDRNGIGRFGMGLPAASISQCRRVDVWTWMAGPDNAAYSYLDLGEVESGAAREVPAPIVDSVPAIWRELSAEPLGQSGTIVVWSALDKVTWRGAAATLENTQFLIGRIYRKLIHDDGLLIRLAAVRDGDVVWETDATPNDPMYLMAPSCTPAPFDSKPMFRPWGETGEMAFKLRFNGIEQEVTIRLSWATDESRLTEDGTEAGSKDYVNRPGFHRDSVSWETASCAGSG